MNAKAYKPAEAAALIGVGRSTVYDLINSGRLEVTDVGTGTRKRLRITEEEIYDFLKRRRLSVPKRRGRAA